ncbi:LruC domain-containing protein [Bacteroides ovatus]|nr:LruC domain-containing protein [Bacteroides ovatus]
MTIPLKAVTSNVSMMKFNPFIFVNKRSHEIHLTDFAPTSKMDMNLLGNGKDCSDVSKRYLFPNERYVLLGIGFSTNLQMKRHGDIRKKNHQW